MNFLLFWQKTMFLIPDSGLSGLGGFPMRSLIRSIPPPLAAVIALGIGNQIGQILLLRELLMVFHGHELTIGIIIAFWVGWEAAGSWFGALIAERSGRPQYILTALVVAVVIVMPAVILLIRVLRGFFDAVPGTHLSLYDTVATCFFVMAPLCMLMGAQFVLIARLWRVHRRANDMSGAVRGYAMEAVGHMTGGLLFSLLLVHVLSPLQTAAFMGVLMLGGVQFLLRTAPRKRLAAVMLLTMLLAAVPFLNVLDMRAFRVQWEHFMPDSRLVETRRSKYGIINVALRRDQYSFFQSNHLAFSTGGPDADPAGLEEIQAAHLTHLAMSQHPEPAQVLLIGGGMRGVLREMLRYEGVSIDYVELDSVLIETARPYLPRSTLDALDDRRVNVLTTDGRLHVKTTSRRYDVVLVDLPDPATAALNRFYTREFFREVSARLNPGGVITLTAASTPGLRHSAVVNRNAAIYHTLRDVFPDVLAAGESVCLFFASNTEGRLTADASVLGQRYIRQGIESPDFSPRHFYTLLQDIPLRRKNWILRHHGRAPNAVLEPPDTGPILPGTLEEQKTGEAELPPVDRHFFINSDDHPIGYYHTLIFLDRMAGRQAETLLRGMLRVRLWWPAAFAAVAVALGLGLRIFAARKSPGGGQSYAVGFSVFAVGFASMVFEVALLFAFQSVYGYVFEQIGLIVALFMGGLAAGARLSQRFMPRLRGMRSMAALQAGFVLFAGTLAVGVPMTAALRSPALIFVIFALATFAAGVLNGAHYPVAAAFRLALSARTERSAGFVYAVELAGACAGASLAGVAFVPVLGLTGAFLAAGILNAAAFLIICTAAVNRR